MTDRRLPIIRAYAMLAVMALASLLWPEWTMFFWAVGIIPCPTCCGGEGCEATCAGGIPTQLQIDLAGFDGFCNAGVGDTCDNQYNVTEIVDPDISAFCTATYTNSCMYVNSANFGCSSLLNKAVCLEIGISSGSTIGMIVKLIEGAPHWIFRDDDIGLTSGANCTTISSVSLPETQVGAFCDPGSPNPTCVVTSL